VPRLILLKIKRSGHNNSKSTTKKKKTGEKKKKRMVVKEESSCVYKNGDAPVEARVKDLLSRMTLPEKIGQMTQIERRVASASAFTDFFIGTHIISFFELSILKNAFAIFY